MVAQSMVEPLVEVRRSRRRRRTVAAYREDGKVVVLIPARLSADEEAHWVRTMVARLERSERRRRPTDEALARRAQQLSDRYLGGLAVPETVRWVDNQNARWGSCTPADASIRLSSRLQPMPTWVVDYVLLHELVHLIEPGHTPEFWGWVERYPKAERARGFLEGWSAAGHDTGDDDPQADDERGDADVVEGVVEPDAPGASATLRRGRG